MKSFKQVILILSIAILFGALAGGAVIAGLGMAFFAEFSNQWENGDLVPATNSIIFDRYGKQVAELHGAENRVLVSFEKIPLPVKNAFLAVEDVRFYQHPGLDIKSIIRSAFVDLQEEKLVQGGSTITQQLVRNAFLSQEKTWLRKVKELIMAREIEQRYSKNEILTLYLNRIYFGHGVYGVQAASRLYFNKDVGKLKPEEAALLAGIPKNPGYYSPYKNPEAALSRRNLVLTIMEGYQLLAPMEADQARAADLKVVSAQSKDKIRFPYFVDQVIQEVAARYGIAEESLYRGGYRIYSTLDPKVQSIAEATLAKPNNFPLDIAGVPVQGAIASIDYTKGEVRALAGGRSYQTVRGFNRAVQLRRQPGSAIKPLVVYAPALEKGFPIDYRLSGNVASLGSYQPQNYGGQNFGSITMSTALKQSVNVYAVRLLQELGVDTGYQMGRALGLPLVPGDKGLALALGGLTEGVSPLEMAAAFGTFGSDGIFREPVTILRVLDGNGLEVKGKKARQERVITPKTARTMTVLLEEVINSGTGIEARLSSGSIPQARLSSGSIPQASLAPVTIPSAGKVGQGQTVNRTAYGLEATVQAALLSKPLSWAAGKTGTVQLPNTPEFRGITGNKDAWFVGYTPELSTAVWIGFDRTDRQHYLKGVTGGTYPARIWKSMMEQTYGAS